MLTPVEIAAKAEELREFANRIQDPTMSNYKKVLASYRRVLNDVLVLIRELARHNSPHVSTMAIQATQPGDPE